MCMRRSRVNVQSSAWQNSWLRQGSKRSFVSGNVDEKRFTICFRGSISAKCFMQRFMNGWIKVHRFFRFSLQHLWSDEELRQCKEFQSSVFGTLIEKTGTQSSRNSICSIGQQLRIKVLLCEAVHV